SGWDFRSRISSNRTSTGGALRGVWLEMHVGADAVELDGALEELPVRGVPVVVLAEDLQLRGLQRGGLELQAAAGGDVGVPIRLLPVLHIDTRDRTHVIVEERDRALELDSSLRRPGLQVGRILVEEVPAPCV